MADPAYGGHRGKLILGGVEVTGPEGATYDPAPQSAEYGGYGQNHRRKAAVMRGVPMIEVKDTAWNPSSTTVFGIITTMQTGGRVAGYWYPRGQDDGTIYVYGYWVLDAASMEAPIDDVIRQPFSLAAASDITQVGF